MMRKVGVFLLSGLGCLLLLYTCVGPILPERLEKHQESVDNSELDTSYQVAEDSHLTKQDSTPQETSAEVSQPEPTPVSQVAKEATESSRRTPSRLASASRFGKDVRLSPMPVKRIEVNRPATHDLRRGTPTILTVLSDVSVQDDSLQSSLRIPIPEPDVLGPMSARGHPASTINTPTAYGPGWKEVYAGVAYQNRIRYDDWRDGVAAVGMGLGDPEKYVGLDVRLNVLDTYTNIAEDRSLSLELHRHLPYRSAIAVGYENIWHTDGTDGGSSRYVVVSKVLFLRNRPTRAFGSMVVNLGLGTDRFLPERRFARGEGGMNVFGSLALRMHPRLNAIANWTGQDLALGVSIAPLPEWPVVITPAVVDVTGRAGDGARFSVSVGLGYTFGQ